MASKNKDERAHVNALIKAMQKNSLDPFYVHVDRDAGGKRHTSSGWDFLLAFDGRVVFCEAKEENGKLSDWQEFAQAQIKAAGNDYFVVRFWEDGKFFTADGGQKFETENASLKIFTEL